jgi:hypothetical protein
VKVTERPALRSRLATERLKWKNEKTGVKASLDYVFGNPGKSPKIAMRFRKWGRIAWHFWGSRAAARQNFWR